MGLNKYAEQHRFTRLVKSLSAAQCVVVVDDAAPPPQLIDLDRLFGRMRRLGYEYSGLTLADSYHLMSAKAHRVMNRFSRLMSLYAF